MLESIGEHLKTWNLHLNQVLAPNRFNMNESTKFSPFYLLYNHDPVLPVDNIPKPQRKYLGEEPHKIGKEQQHKAFVLVHQHLKKRPKKKCFLIGIVNILNFSIKVSFRVCDAFISKLLR